MEQQFDNLVFIENPDFRERTGHGMTGHDFNDVRNVDRYVRRSLVGVSRSITKILHDNFETIMAMDTVPGITLMIAKLFAEQELNTAASNRLLDNIGCAPSADVAKGIVCNSFLSGDGNGVIRI